MFSIRKLYYYFIYKISEIKLIKNFIGFGLYDKKIIDLLKDITEPEPYFRGLICELGFDIYEIEFNQPIRKKGKTKNNFYTLYDFAMIGITHYSKIPIRLATMIGFLIGFISLLVAIGYFFYKLLFWKSFSIGIAPLVIGFFFFTAIQLFFIGIIGEYIGSIHTLIQNKPLVIEKERINF